MKRLPLVLLPLLAACSSLPSMPKMPDFASWVTPYKIDVRQGNFVSQEMVSQLKPGMSKDQVRFALGSPLLTDMFHADRWDYVYRLQQGNGKVEERKITILFDQDKLARVTGDVVPAPVDAAAQPAAPVAARVVEINAPAGSLEKAAAEPAKPAGKSWLDKLWPF